MDSSEEITDDILSYLLDNARESDSSFVNEKSGNFSDVSFLTDTNPLLEPASPSLKSVFSSKKLEWDSSADVGCLAGPRPGFQLSSIEKMALSNSASKLCYEEDDHSQALIAKIDLLLGRSKKEERNFFQILPVLPSVESSNGSLDTVIPSVRHLEQKENRNLEFDGETQGARNKISDSTTKPPTINRICISHNAQCTHTQNLPDSNSMKTISSSQTSPFPTQRSLTRSRCDGLKSPSVSEEECNSAVTSLSVKKSSKSKSVKQNVVSDAGQTLRGHREKSASSTEGLKSPCKSHQNLNSQEKKKRRKQVMQELQVYRGLREHLENLKEYVTQLENTWKFLDETQSRTSGSSSSFRRSKTENRQKEPTERNVADTLTSSSMISTSVISVASKSDRSFDIEPLDLQNSDNESQKRLKPKNSKFKCCSHCSLNLKTSQSTYRSKSGKDMSVQVEETPTSCVEPVIEAQKEPIAFDISVRSKSEKTSLQEALKTKRPDFFVGIEERRKIIQDMTRMRLDKIDANSIPRIFTYQQSRQNTEKIYRQLPEAKSRNQHSNRKAIVCTNRIRAADFQKVTVLFSSKVVFLDRIFYGNSIHLFMEFSRKLLCC